FQAEDGIRDRNVTGVQTCALPISYTKGCYTGQETVSRLHFRGHANRNLRGLLFESDPPAAPASGWSAVTHEDRDVGRVTSIAWRSEERRVGKECRSGWAGEEEAGT